MVGDLFGAVVLIFLVLTFYRLFKSVDQHLAVLVVIPGGVMPALIDFVNVARDAGALIVVRGARPFALDAAASFVSAWLGGSTRTGVVRPFYPLTIHERAVRNRVQNETQKLGRIRMPTLRQHRRKDGPPEGLKAQ